MIVSRVATPRKRPALLTLVLLAVLALVQPVFGVPDVTAVVPRFGPVDGGTTVVLTLDGAITNGTSNLWQCSFGGIDGIEDSRAIGVYLDSTKLACVTPPCLAANCAVTVPTDVKIRDLNLGGAPTAWSTAAGGTFTYYERESVTAINPDFSVPNEIITLTGTNFYEDAEIAGLSHCLFDKVAVPAEWVSSTEVTCIAPQYDEGRYTVEFASNGVDFTSDGQLFQFQGDLIVANLSPRGGNIAGGFPVTVIGDNILPTAMVRFGFDTPVYQPIIADGWLSYSAVVVTAPAVAESTSVPVEVSNDNTTFTDNGIIFSFQDSHSVTGATPAVGTSAGGTSVTVLGDGFVNTDFSRCIFRKSSTATVFAYSDGATFATPTKVVCVTPAVSPDLTSTFVSYANNGEDFPATAVRFRFARPAVVTGFSIGTGPLQLQGNGPVTGGTEVYIVGLRLGLLAGTAVRCAFGVSVVDAVASSETHIVCLSPPTSSPGEVALEISVNSVDFTTSGATFLYHNQVNVDELDPPSGPYLGGTTVTVKGSNFFDSDPLLPYVRIGGVPHVATYLSSSMLEVTTTNQTIGQAVVDVSFNTDDWTFDAISFDFQEPPVVLDASPPLADVNGGQLVHVTGLHFTNTELVSCRFGGAGQPSVDAVWLSEERISCVVPASPGLASGVVSLDVSNNNLDFTPVGFNFTYVPLPTIASFSIESGPMSGGTVVNVTGTDFFDSGMVTCRIENAEKVAVPAVVFSSTLLQCVMPRVATAGSFAIEVSTNGHEYTADAFTFEFYVDPTVVSLSTSSGPVTGATSIVVTGTDFVNDPVLAVRFGADEVLCAWTSTSTCDADTPAVVSTGLVDVQVTNNGADWSSGPVHFAFYDEASPLTLEPASVPSTGSQVIVRGANFENSQDLRCLLDGSPTSARWINAGEIICTIPPTPASASVALTVTNNLIDESASVSLEIYEAVSVDSLSVPAGPASGGTPIVVTGQDFVNTPELACAFGDATHMVAATFSSSTELSCVTPAHVAELAVTVHVSLNGKDLSVSSQTFDFYPDPHVDSLSVTTGVANGGTTVTVYGSNFDNTYGMELAIGPDTLTPSFTSSTVLTFSTPDILVTGVITPGTPTLRDVEVSLNNGVDYTNDHVLFEYHYEPTVATVDPVIGPASGNSLVTVTGTNFVNSALLQCRWDGVAGELTQATFVSDTELRCHSPQGFYAGLTVSSVEVTNNGVDFTPTSVVYTAYPDPSVVSVDRTSGPELGGTTVTVHGADFHDGINRCRFGNYSVSATVSDPLTAECISPEHAPGVVAFAWSSNGQDYTTQDVTFEFMDEVSITSLLRTRSSVDGGFNVTVFGTNFRPDAEAETRCKFGPETPVPAVVASDTELYCVTPAHVTEEIVHVELSLNDDDFTSQQTEFRYVGQPIVTSVTPTIGSELGNSIITVEGSEFFHSDQLKCRFGELTPVLARWVSETHVECASPVGTATGVPVHVEISINDLEYTDDAVEFLYVGETSVSSLQPLKGPIVGNSPVSVIGNNFRWSAGELVCRFGEDTVVATFVNSTLLTCLSPPSSESKTTTVEVSNNLVDFTSGGLTYEYVASPQVISVTPFQGDFVGGTTVTVTGTDFLVGQTWVKFGDADSIKVTNFNSNEEFVVDTPPYSAGSVPVEVSANDVEFSKNGVVFTYTGDPEVFSLEPTRGPLAGSTKITVFGVNFQNTPDLVCKFGGGLDIAASFIGPFRISCLSPASGVAAPLALEVRSTAAGAYSTSGVQFSYDDPIAVTALSPDKGPASGGTVVELTGTDFLPAGSTYPVQCRFGPNAVVGTLDVAETTLTCIAPRSFVTGPVTVYVTNNGQNWLDSGETYTYQADVTIDSLLPTSGPRSGSTEVTITGSNFVSGDILCKIGSNIITPTFDSSNVIRCLTTATPGVDEEAQTVEVTNNQVDYTSSLIQFTFYEDPTVVSLEPLHGPALGGTYVTLTGTNFRDTRTLHCLFDGDNSLNVEAEFWDSEHVRCPTPDVSLVALATADPMTVEISNNNQDFTADAVTYQYDDDVTVSSVDPTYGPATGDVTVAIAGINFQNTGAELMCLFGSVAVPFDTFTNSNAITCKSPRLEPGVYTVEVTINGLHYTSDGVTYEAREPVVIESITPTSGKSTGNTVVTVTGRNFVADGDLECKIGAQLLATTFVSDTEVTCVTLSETVGVYDLDMTQNGQDWTSSHVPFEFQALPVGTSVSPASGPTDGETYMTVVGTSFINSAAMSCKFVQPNVLVTATFHSSTQIVCVTPPTATGTVDIELTANNIDFNPTGQTFEYVDPAVVTSVAPTHGPMSGESSVVIAGSGFIDGPGKAVYFGFYDATADCTWDSPIQITCDAPAVLDSGALAVETTNNGADYSSSAVLFTFDELVRIDEFVPRNGPVGGGTTIVVHGSGFLDTPDLKCEFTGHAPVAATFISSTELECVAPNEGSAGAVEVEVTNNGVDFSHSHQYYTYYPVPTVDSLTDTLITVNAGVPLTVVGTGFIFSPDLACSIGGVVRPTAFLDTTKLVCEPEPLSAGLYPVEMTNNGQDWTSLGTVEVNYIEVDVLSVSPSVAVETLPVFTANITGSGFPAATVECEWQTDDKERTSATRHSAEFVTCDVPSADRRDQVDVVLIFDDYLRTPLVEGIGILFTPCPTGFYCIDSERIPCPPGTFCPGVRNSNYTICPQGTYNPNFRRSACTPCPKGKICPDVGMTVGEPCPAGFICDDTGLVIATKPCLPGHYCAGGVLSDEPQTDLTLPEWDGTGTPPNVPRLCPGGFYCRGNIPFDEDFLPSGAIHPDHDPDDPRTPQPCMNKFECQAGAEYPQGSGACPLGYMCPPGEAPQMCRPGTFAASTGNEECSLCAAGSYADEYGTIRCKSCPLGHVCRDLGMETPISCPAGFVCDVEGLSDAVTKCPAGYYCEGGVNTVNPQAVVVGTNVTVSAEPPRPCAAGYYCLAGVSSSEPYSASEIDALREEFGSDPARLKAQLSAVPQLCTAGTYCYAATGSEGGVAKCHPGTYCPVGSVAPLPASPGHFTDVEGMSVQKRCPRQTFSEFSGASSCTECPLGYMCPETAMTEPMACDPGMYRAEGSVAIRCFACPKRSVDMRWTIPPLRPQMYPELVEASTTNSSSLGVNGNSSYLESSARIASSLAMLNVTHQGGVTLSDVRAGALGEYVPAGSVGATTNLALMGLDGNTTGDAFPRDGVVIDGVRYGIVQYDETAYAGAAPPWWQPVVLSDANQCRQCPDGFLCVSEGMDAIVPEDLCEPGRVCDLGSDISKASLCPAGHYCYAGTSSENQLDYVCEPGRYCEPGTRSDERDVYLCRAGFYCPGGSTVPNPAETKCPNMTTSDTGSYEFEQCYSVNPEQTVIREVQTSLALGTGVVSDDVDDRGFIIVEPMQSVRLKYDLRGFYDNADDRKSIKYGEVYQVRLTTFFTPSGNEQTSNGRGNVDNDNGIDIVDDGDDESPYGNGTRRASRRRSEPTFSINGRSASARRRNLLDLPRPTHTVDGVPIASLPKVRSIPPRGSVRTHLLQDEGANEGEEANELELPSSLVNAESGDARPDELDLTILASEEELYVRFDVLIVHGRFVFNDTLFENRLSFEKAEPTRATEDPATFFTVLTDDAQTELPLNLAPKDSVAQVSFDMSGGNVDEESRVYVEDYKTVRTTRTTAFPNEEFAIVMPHLPFFSACAGYDSSVILYQVIEDERCELREAAETIFAEPWKPIKPEGDRCDYNIECKFEERLQREEFLPRWFEMGDESVLFYVTRSPTPIRTFVEKDVSYFADQIGSENMVPVLVSLPSSPRRYQVPRTVTLDLGYHQVTSTEKRIMTARLILEDFEYVCPTGNSESRCSGECDACVDSDGNELEGVAPDRSYKLHVVYDTLSYAQLLVLFAFDISLYATIYLGLAIFALSTVVIFWLCHRIVHRKSFASKLNFVMYMKLNVIPHYVALLIDAVPIVLGLIAVWQFGRALFASTRDIPGDFQMYDENFHVALQPSTTTADAFAIGRYSISLLVFAAYICYHSAKILVPARKPTLEEQHAGVNHLWKRSHLLTTSLVFVTGMVIMLEFTYSTTFSQLLFFFIPVLFVIKVFLSYALLALLQEQLLVDGLMLAFTICQYVMTMGASDYFYFLGAFFLTLWLDILSTIYFSRWIRRAVPRVRIAIQSWLARRRGEEYVREEEDEMETATFEMLTYLSQASVMELSLVCTSFVFAYLLLFANELRIYSLYPIPTGSLSLYLIGILIIVGTQLFGAVFLHNTQELQQGWRIFSYLHFTSERFRARGNWLQRWNVRDFDLSIHPMLRSLDSLCFSAHYYSVLMFFAAGLIIGIFGIEMAIRTRYESTNNNVERYNMWADPLLVPIAFIVFGGCQAVNWIVRLVLQQMIRRSNRKRLLEEDEDDGIARRSYAVQTIEDEFVEPVDDSEFLITALKPAKGQPLDNKFAESDGLYSKDGIEEGLPVLNQASDDDYPVKPENPFAGEGDLLTTNTGAYDVADEVDMAVAGDGDERQSTGRSGASSARAKDSMSDLPTPTAAQITPAGPAAGHGLNPLPPPSRPVSADSSTGLGTAPFAQSPLGTSFNDDNASGQAQPHASLADAIDDMSESDLDALIAAQQSGKVKDD